MTKKGQRTPRSSCIYCGTTGKLSKDHVPPQNLFPTPRPSDLITVPACERCNKSFALDDDYFRIAVVVPADPKRDPIAASLWSEKVVRGTLRRSPARQGRVLACTARNDGEWRGQGRDVDVEKTHQQPGGSSMAQSNRGKLLTTFRYPMRVEVRRPKFERSASLAYIDIAKLAQAARAEFEVGHLEAGCCQKTVLAVVRRGMVTALRVEGCAQCKPVRLTPELQAMLKTARRRIGRRRDGPFRPMSVAQFIGRAAGIVIGECHLYCFITILGYDLCVFCCDLGGFSSCVIVIHPTLDGRLFQ